MGIIAHEGQLFGVLNQLLGTVAALGVLLLAISGLVMWWQRRPPRRFSETGDTAALPRPVFVGVLALAFLLPLLAATFVLSLAVDWLVRRKKRPAMA